MHVGGGQLCGGGPWNTEDKIAKAKEAGGALKRHDTGGVELGKTYERIQAAWIELQGMVKDVRKDFAGEGHE